MTGWRVAVDKKACIGSSICVAIAPDRFVLDENQRSGAIAAEIDPDELVRDAAASCPAVAISIVDVQTGEAVELE